MTKNVLNALFSAARGLLRDWRALLALAFLYAALIAELAVAVPVRPAALGAVVEVDAADLLDLLAPGGDRVFDQKVRRGPALDRQARDDGVARTHLAAERLGAPLQFVAAVVQDEPQVLARYLYP